MAAIASIDATQTGAFLATGATLGSSDTITFRTDRKQLLVLTNGTGGSITAKLTGSQATSQQIPGYGPVALSGGFDVVVAAGTARALKLSDIALYLQGDVTITGGSGLNIKLFDL